MGRNANNNPAVENGVIVVGCKLPHGLHLDIEGHGRVTLNGSNTATVIGGYGLTENVNAEFFGEWCMRNSQHAALVNGLIFPQTTTAEARAEATDKASIRNGFEAINAEKPETAVAGIEKTASE